MRARRLAHFVCGGCRTFLSADFKFGAITCFLGSRISLLVHTLISSAQSQAKLAQLNSLASTNCKKNSPKPNQALGLSLISADDKHF